MGYKLAGFDHLGGVEYDKDVAAVYDRNHKPKHLFVEDIREFNKRDDIPQELYNIDLLDGSPPCSSFSMAGNRDKDWGKKKQFREGQAFQRLDDLVFEYIETIRILQPKVALLENVKGLITGNAKAYAKNMKIAFEAAGYRVQVFLLNAASMGVPQKRERVFFIGIRKDFDFGPLVLGFDEKPIVFDCFIEHNAQRQPITQKYGLEILKTANKSGVCRNGKNTNNTGFYYRARKKAIPHTINSGVTYSDYTGENYLTKGEFCQIGSYPLDYDFSPLEPKYLIGMSVPPVMTAQISHQIYLQWLSKIPKITVIKQ